jgi:hypothetical protein
MAFIVYRTYTIPTMVVRIHAIGGAIDPLAKPRFWNMGIRHPARTIASGLNIVNVAPPKTHAVLLRSVIVFYTPNLLVCVDLMICIPYGTNAIAIMIEALRLMISRPSGVATSNTPIKNNMLCQRGKVLVFSKFSQTEKQLPMD